MVALTIAARLKRVGRETKRLIEGEAIIRVQRRTAVCCACLPRLTEFRPRVLQGGGQTIAALVAEPGVGASCFTRILRSSFLAPDVATAILQGRQAPEPNAKRLSRHRRLPIGWNDQVAALGIR